MNPTAQRRPRTLRGEVDTAKAVEGSSASACAVDPPMQAKPSMSPEALELRVLAGPQAGARVPWPATGGALVLRAGEDIDDTIRADLLIDSERPALLRLRAQRDGEARVEVLSGAVTIGDHTHATGAVFRWPLLVPMQIGDSAAIAVGEAQAEIWPLAPLYGDSNRSGDETDDAADSSRRADAIGNGADAGSDGDADADGSNPMAGIPPRGRVDTWLAGGGAVLGIAGLVWSLLITLPTAPHAAVPVLVAQTPVPAPHDELVFEAPAAGRAEPAPVEPKPAAEPEPPRPPTLPSAGNEPGKRIVTLVSQGQLPHLVTADGTRYFVGAVLPSGHRVAAVLPQALVLERDGQQSRIEF
ncbi:hypothetical protein [Roseateles sp.]|uniref:SctD/MshK family protein n=1 Tax=Roseateles sp. TaxID=1971397 RepID=UPI0031E32176